MGDPDEERLSRVAVGDPAAVRALAARKLPRLLSMAGRGQLARRTLASFGDEPFDADAKLAALRQARAVEAEGRVEMDRRIVTFAATLPAADRARFGEALARPAAPRLGRGGVEGRAPHGRPQRARPRPAVCT